MLKKLIKYEDFDGNQREEEFYFNLTKAEVLEMELAAEGGLEKTIKRIIETQNKKELIALFKSIILKAYGEKSPDGRRFIKSEELSTAFSQTGAYENLFMELITDENQAAAFVNSIVPKDLAEQVKNQ